MVDGERQIIAITGKAAIAVVTTESEPFAWRAAPFGMTASVPGKTEQKTVAISVGSNPAAS